MPGMANLGTLLLQHIGLKVNCLHLCTVWIGEISLSLVGILISPKVMILVFTLALIFNVMREFFEDLVDILRNLLLAAVVLVIVFAVFALLGWLYLIIVGNAVG